jgi:pimeloyl-ACP methyl ester carboxylesterase
VPRRGHCGRVSALGTAAGYRVIVPFARGYGTIRFLSDDAPRNGQQAVLAADLIDLMDALGIEQAILAGFDWGGRSADVVASLWPDRSRALVSVSGYLIGSQAANAAPLPPAAEHAWWYQFCFATERGRAGPRGRRYAARNGALLAVQAGGDGSMGVPMRVLPARGAHSLDVLP